MLDPAPPPEDRRGVAEPGRSAARCARRSARRPSPPARRSATRTRAPSSSCSRESGEFFFLEVNTRLQVEHPVTESRDRARPRAAADRGRARRARCRRRRSCRRRTATRSRCASTPRTPSATSRPSTGTLHRFALRPGPGLRLDSGVEDGSEVSVHYDPMLAKVIAWAPARARRRRCSRARSRARASTAPRTNRDLLVRILRHPEFLAGRTDTHFLERHRPAELGAPLCDAAGERVHALAAALALQAERRAAAPRARFAAVRAGATSRRRTQCRSSRDARGRIAVAYRFGRDGVARGGRRRARSRASACTPATPEEVDLEVAGVRRRIAVHARGRARLRRQRARRVASSARCRASPSPRSSSPRARSWRRCRASCARCASRSATRVAKGDVLLVLEAMKMETPIRAPRRGPRDRAPRGRRRPGRGGRAARGDRGGGA